MAKNKLVKVPIADSVRMGQRVAVIEEGATKGAVIGTNVYTAEGTLYVPAAQAPGGGGAAVEVYWRVIREVPPNLVAIAALTGAGLVRRMNDGSFDLAQEGYPPQLGHARI